MRIRRKILDRDPLCVECVKRGRVSLAVEVDHIEPLHKGGTDDHDNLRGLCRQCHADITAEQNGSKRVAFGVDGWPVGVSSTHVRA